MAVKVVHIAFCADEPESPQAVQASSKLASKLNFNASAALNVTYDGMQYLFGGDLSADSMCVAEEPSGLRAPPPFSTVTAQLLGHSSLRAPRRAAPRAVRQVDVLQHCAGGESEADAQEPGSAAVRSRAAHPRSPPRHRQHVEQRGGEGQHDEHIPAGRSVGSAGPREAGVLDSTARAARPH